MSSLFVVREHLDQASDLAAILDAACNAFESMLSVLRAHEDPGDPMFGAVVLAAASAADGRDAVLSAPSLPPHRLRADAEEGCDDVGAVADVLAGLSELLAARLDDAARIAPDPDDQAACQAAARWARDIHALLTGNAP